MKEIEKIAIRFCYENGIDVKLSYDMPAGYETAYGTYDVTINTLFLNTSILRNAPNMRHCSICFMNCVMLCSTFTRCYLITK